ncbi:MAG: hypothetical protein HUU10_02490 [Bacteroidetes bacterium]|nr:hypothetical protein [Bacteroidota bacterium]
MNSTYCSEHWEKQILSFLHRPGPDALDKIRKHTSGCVICRKSLDEQLAFRQLFRSIPQAGVSESFDNRLKNRINRIEQERRSPIYRNFEWFTLLLTVVTGGMIVLIFYLYFQMVERMQRPQPEQPARNETELVLPDR